MTSRLVVVVFCLAMLFFGSCIWAQTISKLPTVNNYPTKVVAINDLGDIVGYIQTPSNDLEPVLWSGQNITNLRQNYGLSTVYDINNAGQIIGTVKDSLGFYQSALIQNGQKTVLPAPATATKFDSFPTQITNNGVIIGLTKWLDGQYLGYEYNINAKTWVYISDPSPNAVYAKDSSGNIYGQSGQNAHATAWLKNGENICLCPNFSHSSCKIIGANSPELIIGVYSTQNGRTRGYLINKESCQYLDDFGGRVFEPLAVNDFCQVVGRASDIYGNQFGFINQLGHSTKISDLITNPIGWQITTATDINNARTIIGNGLYQNANCAYIIYPVSTPEPNTICILGFGIGCLYLKCKSSPAVK